MSIPFLFPFFIQSLLSRVHKEPGLNGRPKDFILPTRFLSLSDRNECSNFIHWVLFLRQDFTMRPWHSLGRLDRTWIEFRALPVSKSLMLGQNVCITIPGATFGPKLSPVPGFHK